MNQSRMSSPTAKLDVDSAPNDPVAVPLPYHHHNPHSPLEVKPSRDSHSSSTSPGFQPELDAENPPISPGDDQDNPDDYEEYDEDDYDEDEDEDGSDWSATPPPRYLLQRGGPAARKVYDNLEVRHRILALTDRSTLGRMLRLERAVSESVARVLFRSVNKAVKMSRANPRRRIYCDAVREVDRSPYPSLIPVEKRPFRSDREPIYFDHREATKLVTAGRKKFPNLQRILHLYPSHDVDDAWIINIKPNNKITIDLESHVEYDLHDIELFNLEPPTLPGPPQLPQGWGIRYTIAIKLIAQDQRSQDYWAENKGELKPHLKRWHDWLYLNPDLDRRVTSIERWLYDYCNPADVPYHRYEDEDMYRPDHWNPRYRVMPIDPYAAPSIVDPTLDEALAFLAQRKRGNCKPMTTFTIPPSPTPVDMNRFQEILAALNPEIRSLRVHKSIIQTLPSTQTAIAAFDAAFPNLCQLAIVHDAFGGVKPKRSYFERTPLSGLPNLRNFVSHIQMPGNIDSPQVGRFVCRLGTDKCVHQNLEIRSMSGMKWGADEVHEVKPYVLGRRTYRYGDGYVLRPEEETDQIELRETRVESEWGDYYILE